MLNELYRCCTNDKAEINALWLSLYLGQKSLNTCGPRQLLEYQIFKNHPGNQGCYDLCYTLPTQTLKTWPKIQWGTHKVTTLHICIILSGYSHIKNGFFLNFCISFDIFKTAKKKIEGLFQTVKLSNCCLYYKNNNTKTQFRIAQNVEASKDTDNKTGKCEIYSQAVSRGNM